MELGSFKGDLETLQSLRVVAIAGGGNPLHPSSFNEKLTNTFQDLPVLGNDATPLTIKPLR